MKAPASEVPLGNQLFAGIKFYKFYGFWLIWQKLVPAKTISKLAIHEIREI